MTLLIGRNGNTKIQSCFSEAKNFFLKKGGIIRESRTCINGEDLFLKGKYMGVLLYDGETKEKLIEW